MEDSVFNDIDYKNKVKPTPKPSKINDIDVEKKFLNTVIEASDNQTLDLNTINSFTNISQNRDEIYNMIDVMCEDPMISTALNIYASDACEPNENGEVVWVESSDQRISGMVKYILDQINIDKNAYNWVYSLIKYGDLYLRLVRDSEFNDELFGNNDDKKLNEAVSGLSEEGSELNEDLIVRTYKSNDHYAEYLEAHKNPAEMFDLQRFGKTAGFIKTNITSRNTSTDDISQLYTQNNFMYNFNRSDIILYPATEFVHASLVDNYTRNTEQVTIFDPPVDENGKPKEYTYSVKKGQSLLYNKFRIWRELSLLENSVMLNRITKSSIVRTVQVEVGDMEKSDVRALLQRIKSMVEQKSAVNVGKTYENYTNPGPIENTIYIPVHDQKGAITVGQIGGDVQTDDLNDINYFKNKLYGALGIPKQFLGDTEDAAGFNGGTSLSLISSQYAKSVKKIQNTFIQAVTDAVNLILLDKGLTSYINEFKIKMQAPTTQEEKDRKENVQTSINNIREINSLIQEQIEDPQTKLTVLKTLLSPIITDPDVMTILQNEIDKISNKETEEPEESGEFNTEEFSAPEDFDTTSTEMEIPEEPSEEQAEEPTNESVETDDLITEDDKDYLPSWEELNTNYNE